MDPLGFLPVILRSSRFLMSSVVAEGIGAWTLAENLPEADQHDRNADADAHDGQKCLSSYCEQREGTILRVAL